MNSATLRDISVPHVVGRSPDGTSLIPDRRSPFLIIILIIILILLSAAHVSHHASRATRPARRRVDHDTLVRDVSSRECSRREGVIEIMIKIRIKSEIRSSFN